jgi:hypothetical protein
MRRIYWAIRPVVREFKLEPSVLFTAVAGCGGAVVGRAASKVMAYGMDWEERYKDLCRVTVMVPRGRMVSMIEELEERLDSGFERVQKDWSGEGAAVNVWRVWEAKVKVGTKVCPSVHSVNPRHLIKDIQLSVVLPTARRKQGVRSESFNNKLYNR